MIFSQLFKKLYSLPIETTLEFHNSVSKNKPEYKIEHRKYYPAEVESRTQGSRPRTQKKSEAKDSLSEDRPSRGQGQEWSRPRPRTQAQAFSKKKVFKNFFSGDLQFIGIPRIFDWGRPKPQITCNDVIKIFPKRKLLWDEDIIGWKI